MVEVGALLTWWLLQVFCRPVEIPSEVGGLVGVGGDGVGGGWIVAVGLGAGGIGWEVVAAPLLPVGRFGRVIGLVIGSIVCSVYFV